MENGRLTNYNNHVVSIATWLYVLISMEYFTLKLKSIDTFLQINSKVSLVAVFKASLVVEWSPAWECEVNYEPY